MSDWDNIDEELKKLEDEFSADDGIMRELATPSAADYWKKRLDEEKELWSKMIETKEEEKKALQAELGKQEKDIEGLKEHLRKIQEGFEEESQAWQERLKVKETELVLEKERVGWEDKYKGLQYEVKILQEELERAKRYYEEESQKAGTAHRKELEELLSSQNTLMETLESLQSEISGMQQTVEEQLREKRDFEGQITLQEEKLLSLSRKDEALEKENIELKSKLDYSLGEIRSQKTRFMEYMASIAGYFSDRVRNHMGTVFGLVNFCLRRMHFGSSRVIRKQLINMNGAVDRVLQTLEAFTGMTLNKSLDFQETTVERLFAKLIDDMDTASIPFGLKLEVNYLEFKSAITPYLERAAKRSLGSRIVPVGNVIILELVLNGELKSDAELVHLRRVIFLHQWGMKTVFENGSTTLLIEIPIVEA